jgi:hypothetical protein
MELRYNPVERASSLAAVLGRVDEGERARTLHIPFFGHAERTAHTFTLRCCASLRGHLRFQWLHVLFFGIVKPTFSPPAAKDEQNYSMNSSNTYRADQYQ